MTTNDKLQAAIARLTLSRPWLAPAVLVLPTRISLAVTTAATDGHQILINPLAIDDWYGQELEAVIAHETMHVVLRHHARQKGRDMKRWNRASDREINDQLAQAGLTLPPGVLFGSGDLTVSAEKYYELETESSSSAVALDCDLASAQPGLDPGQREKIEQDVDAARQRILASRYGDQAGSAMRRAEEGRISIDWRAALAAYCWSLSEDDTSWSHPNRRYPCRAGYDRHDLGKVAIVVDTSGSIDDVSLRSMIADVSAIASMGRDVWCAACDCKIQSTAGPGQQLELRGGGGTDFRPGLEWAGSLSPDVAIYLTDTQGEYPAAPPSFPVIWAVRADGSNTPRPPFGVVISIKGE
jgi:predicted metal-dependent peptidase